MKTIFFLSLLLVFGACKKDEIHFEDLDVITSGKIDENSPLQSEWTAITTSGITNIHHIETDGVNLYFDGVTGSQNCMFKMTPDGQINTLYSVGASSISSENVTHLSYHSPYVYACHKGLGNNSVKIFNETGIINNINFNSTSNYKINDIEDMGSYLLIGGYFNNGLLFPQSNILRVDKSTYAMSAAFSQPLGSDATVMDIENVNGSVYLAGERVKSNSNLYGYGIAKWTGSAWEGYGPTELLYSDLYAPQVYAINFFENQIYVTGEVAEDDFLSIHVGTLSGSISKVPAFYNKTGIKIRTKKYDEKLFLFGDVGCSNYSFASVYYQKNGSWHAAGILNYEDVISDVAFLNGQLYGVVNGGLKKYTL